MPVHLDPLSRRRFFQGAAIFTASGLGFPLRAATSTETWALLSDTHIAEDPGKLSRGVNLSEHLERVVAEVLQESEHLSGVIIDGDVAFNDGQSGDYTQLKKLLQPLVDAGLPIHCTLGNHDDRVNFLAAYPEADGTSALEGRHCSVVETEHLNLILIDTLRFVNKVEGEIGETQLEWISDYLNQHPEKPSIILGHHYPQVFRTNAIPSDQEIKISGLVDSQPFEELLKSHPSAKAYLFGHSHRWEVMEDEHELHRINLPPTAYVFDETRPSGWVRANFSHNGMKLELRALDREHPEHGKIHDLAWR
ncbi:MAG: metallophosphoesterase [Verrucomicrobiales bacterium]|nr:metallophosphoesterase [bacterium]MDF2375391.1 metallophosphoesterase [Verrucomicrobiales bacterium]